jgi:hypothetical protein
MKHAARFLLTLPALMLCIASLAQHDTLTRSSIVSRKNAGHVTAKFYSKSYALLIGVSKYNNGMPDLPGAAEDIDSVKAALAAHEFDVKTIINPPTSQGLADSIAEFISNVGEDSRVIIYYAGHGTEEEGGGLIVSGIKNDLLTNSIVPLKDLVTICSKIEAKHFLLVLDGCYLGKAADYLDYNRPGSRGAKPDEPLPAAIETKLEKKARFILTSGTRNQEVPDKSVFRQFFIRGINGEADLMRDGYVSLIELKTYLEVKVSENSTVKQWIFCDRFRDEWNQALDISSGEIVFKTLK